MPSYLLHNFGNLYVQFDVKFPESLFTMSGDLKSNDKEIEHFQKLKNTIEATAKKDEDHPEPEERPPTLDEKVDMLRAALSGSSKPTQIPPNAMTDDFELEQIDLSREGPRARAATAEDEEDEMGAGGERVQCASQ